VRGLNVVSQAVLYSPDLRWETLCDPDFATCAAAEGTEVRVELSLGEIEKTHGYVVGGSQPHNTSQRRKELDRLFDKFQVFLDIYDDQRE